MRESEALYLAHGYAIIAETCDVELIDIAIETLTKLRNNLVKLQEALPNGDSPKLVSSNDAPQPKSESEEQ